MVLYPFLYAFLTLFNINNNEPFTKIYYKTNKIKQEKKKQKTKPSKLKLNSLLRVKDIEITYVTNAESAMQMFVEQLSMIYYVNVNNLGV